MRSFLVTSLVVLTSTTFAFAEDAKPAAAKPTAVAAAEPAGVAIDVMGNPIVPVADVTQKRPPQPKGKPLWEAEIRLGYALTQATDKDAIATEKGPIVFGAIATVAVSHEPDLYVYGGIAGEVMGRDAIGAQAGLRFMLPDLPVRVQGGGVWLVAPKTLWGAAASAGACFGEKIGVCGDVQLTAHVAGTALPKDELELQLAFVLGFVARGGQ